MYPHFEPAAAPVPDVTALPPTIAAKTTIKLIKQFLHANISIYYVRQ